MNPETVEIVDIITKIRTLKRFIFHEIIVVVCCILILDPSSTLTTNSHSTSRQCRRASNRFYHQRLDWVYDGSNDDPKVSPLGLFMMICCKLFGSKHNTNTVLTKA